MVDIINPQNLLPNGTRINDVEHIYQSSKPTTRVNGSALVTGDIWYDTNTKTHWIWDNIYWVSQNIYTAQSNVLVAVASGSFYFCVSDSTFKILVIESIISFNTGVDANNRWEIYLAYSSFNASVINIALLSSISTAATTTGIITSSTQYLIDTTEVVSGVARNCLALRTTKIGTPNNLFLAPNISYRRVRP